uniref:G-protein coupled receptors family 1 profile domain-containing protein n=1 Tax=Plectus sambesii TaxID=2011161 RepID=A0A914VL84_9BILA
MESVALSDLWWMSYAPLLTIAHITKTWSCFLLLSATFERYLIASKSTRFMHIVRRRRPAIASATLLLTAVTSGAVFFEVKTVPNEYCTGVNKFTLDLTDLARSPFYGTVFRFYLRNTVTVFLPFILLALLNAGILFTLKGQERRASLFRFASTDHK